MHTDTYMHNAYVTPYKHFAIPMPMPCFFFPEWNLSSVISVGWFAGPHNNTITYHRVNVAYLYCADVVPRCACLALTMVKWYQITLYLQCPPPQIAVSPSSV